MMLRHSAVAVALLIVSVGSAWAAPILDQSFVPGFSNSSDPISDEARAQTFTAGITGDLVGVDLLLFGRSSIEVAIYDTALGSPNNSLQSLPVQVVDGSGYVNFSGFGVPIVAGQLYAIVVVGESTGTLPPSMFWEGVFGPCSLCGEYTGGSRFFQSGVGGPWINTPEIDNAFRTFVEPSAVPEPLSLTLLAMAAAGLLMRRSRRRSAQ